MTDIQVKYWANKELERSNKAREAETNRANLASERENYRHNVATERVASDSLQESIRHNTRTEELTATQIQEQHRSNVANEGIKLATLQETIRSNKAKEAETHRSNVAREYETHRTNVANETLTDYKNIWDYGAKMEANRLNEVLLPSQIKLNEAKAASETAAATKHIADAGLTGIKAQIEGAKVQYAGLNALNESIQAGLKSVGSILTAGTSLIGLNQ